MPAKTGWAWIAFVACQAAWAQTPPPPAFPGAKIQEQVTLQKDIYSSRGSDVPEGYVVDRSLVSYTNALPAEFDRALAGLGPQDRWLDIGAGQARAVLDYYGEGYDATHPEGRERRGSKARVVAMSIEDRRTPLWHYMEASLEPSKIQYLHGKTLREYGPELGRFQLITDLIGGFSYAVNLSVFMEKTLNLLEVNGSFFTVLQDVHSEEGSNRPHYKGAPYLTELMKPDGSELKVCYWLKDISCVEVSCELRGNWVPPIEVYQVRKVCDAVSVPPLETVHYGAGTPPERRYRLAMPAPPSVVKEAVMK